MRTLILLLVLLVMPLPRASAGDSVTMNVGVDERLELLTTVQYLSGYFLVSQAELSYKKEIDSVFAEFKTHEAVKMFRLISQEFFAFDRPVLFMLHYELPNLTLVSPFSEDEIRSNGFDRYRDTLDLFISDLRDFYVTTGFHKFFVDHQQFYQSIVKNVSQVTQGIDIARELESHYGVHQHSYNLILCPLLHDGGFGPKLHSKAGDDLYAIIGPKHDSKGVPRYDGRTLFQNYVIHEFSHSFCNPLIDQYYPQLSKDSCLLEPILKEQREQGYGDWRICLYEHLVRANEVVLTEKIFGKLESDNVYESYFHDKKWIYLKGLVPIIERYSAGRGEHKSLDDVMPEIVTYFHNEKQSCR